MKEINNAESTSAGWLKRATARAGSWLDSYYRSTPPYRLSRGDKLVALVVFALFLLLYYFTCSRGMNLAGDNPELIGASYSLGILHPPGYPLYTLVGYVVTHIPVGSVAFRLSLFSALMHSLTLFILFISLMKITRNRMASAIAVAALGLSYLFWFYSLLGEVFPINDFFAVLLIFTAILVRDRWVSGNKQGAERLFFLLAFLCGLSLTHHHTILMIFPAILLFALHPLIDILKKPRRLALAVLVFLLGLVPYIYLPIRAAQNPYMNFGNPSSLEAFINTITRRYYGSTSLWIGPPAAHRLDLVFDFFLTLDMAVLMAGILLGLVGMFHSASKRIGDFIPLFTAFLITGILFPLMANVSLRSIFDVSTIERFYLLPIIIFTYFIGIGIGRVLSWCKQFVSRFNFKEEIKRVTVWIVALLIALVFFIPAIDTARDVSLRNNYQGDAFVENLFGSIEEGSLIILIGDIPIESGFYYATAYEDPKDVTIISYSFFGQPWYFSHLEKYYPDLNLPTMEEIPLPPDAGLNEFRNWLIDYVIANNPQITNFYISADLADIGERYQLVPWGMTYRMLPKDAQFDLDEYYAAQLDYWENMDERGLDYTLYPANRRELNTIITFTNYIADTAELFREQGRLEEALIFYAIANEIYPDEEYRLQTAYIMLELGNVADAYTLLQYHVDNSSTFDPSTWEAFMELERLQAEMEGQ